MLSGQQITVVIDSRLMEPGKRIKAERLSRRWSQADLAARVGVSQPAIKKIETGPTSRSKFLPKIAEVLGIPLAELDRSLSQNGNGSSQEPSKNTDVRNPTLHIIPDERLMGKTDLPVHSTAQGGRGALVLSSEPFQSIARPHHLLGVRGSYGVLITGNSMAREYNEGDIAYVNPHLPPKKGDACVFQHDYDGTVEAVIKYLERSPDASETVYYVSQTNPPKKFTLRKIDWQRCHVAVGKISGRS